MPSRLEKVQLERKRRVISGFDVDRSWDAEELHLQLSSLLRGTEMEGLKFTISDYGISPSFIFAQHEIKRRYNSFI